MKNEIVSDTFYLVIKETFIFLAIRIVSLVQDLFTTIINQAASNIEIERMKGEVSYAFANFVINHQSSFTAIFVIINFLLWILAISVLVRDGNNIINLIKNGKEKK